MADLEIGGPILLRPWRKAKLTRVGFTTSVGGKIRFRCMFAGSRGARLMEFENHNAPMFGKAWILVAGPISTPDRPVYTIDLVGKKGFQGFRYCGKLF
jgi:hypothetical protein